MHRERTSDSEEVRERYEKYRKDYDEGLKDDFFRQFKEHEWMLQQYSPLVNKSWREEQSRKSLTEARAFMEEVKTGELVANYDPEEASKATSQQPHTLLQP